ncbi:MAG: sugar transferase [Candidatus Eremiobacteraeota bacterium]|nr:sugar transferase [Candidatus Eremiobacteraeota bacterium]
MTPFAGRGRGRMDLTGETASWYDSPVMTTIQQNGFDSLFNLTLPRIKPRPVPADYAAWQRVLLLVADFCVFALAAFGALAITGFRPQAFEQRPEVTMGLLFVVTTALLVYERIGLYRTPFSAIARDQIYASFAAGLLGAIPPSLVLFFVPVLAPMRLTVAIAVVLGAIGMALARFGIQALRDTVAPAPARRIAIVGKPERVDALPKDLSLTNRDSLLRLPTATFDEELDAVMADGDVTKIAWLQSAIDWSCDTLIITEALPSALTPALLRETERRDIKLAFAPLRLRPHACDYRVERDGAATLLYTRSLAVSTAQADFARRALDLALVIPSLIVFSPLLVALAVAIALDSGAPIFYRQTRVGQRGREFEILKFRTMRVDAEQNTGPVWAQAGESRVTRVGRFLRRTSLDELPQLINILRGEMSIVGPRPERPFYVERFRQQLPRYDERHLVRPGITGWAQICMPRTLEPTAVSQKLSYDLFYLENWSIFLDISIIFKTAFEFLFQRAS